MIAPDALARDFDLRNLPAGFADDPFPVYRALRENEPVRRMPDGGVFLTRYADVLAAYRDPATFSSDKRKEFAPKYGEGSRLFRHHTTSLVFNDAPYHARVRRAIVGALIPRALEPLEAKLESLVTRLLDRAGDAGRMEAIGEFAGAIPVEVIGDLLAVPGADRAPLRGWSLAILGALEPVLSAEAREAGERALAEFHDYLSLLIAERRARPGDAERDVLTRLIRSEGEPLGAAELAENCVFLLNAGHETTTNLIGNALELFARFPGARQEIAADPGRLRGAIEEVLRYESSNQLGNRVTTCATEIGGVALAPGTFVTLCIGAANRDPAAFADPEAFDIARNPNRHLAFAAGVHQCAGMNLARMEARIALGRFLKRFPDYALAGPPVRSRRVRFRGFTRLALSWR
ncbi:MAG TPA: cytochrome P450 [Rhizomicrobium sp.]|nr:cytochrome P450 [Rhizomicrobium sp.]